ncbi:MAG: hypothetical protein DBX67_05425 [Desulfovibrionaceae bacterium]|nr:MAG: hypothetical protein DBX67_10255 [Desulfovibrionaceae bacterium]PWM68811.1 MAG: hypothetical protein DBX67_05425 [Desulfovibrionaceae bacterium]
MPYTAVSYLALPRLHPELAAASPRPLPEGTLFLWPGLPRPPQSGVFAPDYPWTPDQAAACLADFERAGREGVRGAPVAAFSALGALGAGDDLSPEERRALSELMGELSSASDRAVDANDETGRQAAQRTLLLAWLQEKQVLELRELEQRVRRGQSALAGLLGEGVVPEADFVGVASGGASLPPWRSVLAAASVFLPRSVAGSDDTAVLALDRDMVATLAALASDQAAGTNENAWMGAERLPEGFSGARIPLGRALGRGWTVPESTRAVFFVYPSAWL